MQTRAVAGAHTRIYIYSDVVVETDLTCLGSIFFRVHPQLGPVKNVFQRQSTSCTQPCTFDPIVSI